jgi:hypothetical protein
VTSKKRKAESKKGKHYSYHPFWLRGHVSLLSAFTFRLLPLS